MADEDKRKKRKPMTDEQKAAKAARERERYKLAKDAGFSPDEARSIKKTLSKMPELIAAPTEAALGLLGFIGRAVDSLMKPDKEKPQDVTKDRPRKTSKAPKAEQPKEKKERRTSPRQPRDYSDFDEFIKDNPDLSARQLQDKWRKEGGKSIGRDKANERVRDVRGKGDKDRRKQQRFSYRSMKDVGKNYLKATARYIYLVEFEVETEDAADTLTEYIHITSDEEMTMPQIRLAVEDAWRDGFQALREKYKAKTLIRESITLIYAVDTHKK